MEKKLGPYKQAVKDAVAASNAKRIEADGVTRHEYPDYDTYRKVQVAGNKAKLRMQFVKEEHIQRLAEHINARDLSCSFGLCHGTRRGLEQTWFRTYLHGDPDVVGTEISDTADQFDHTVQWDFHDENPDWQDRADFVYSNSWDHAFDPEKAFTNWAKQLRPGGIMLLDHTKDQSPEKANALDPFGTTPEALQRILEEALGSMGAVTEILDFTKFNDYRARVFVWTRADS